jgi:5-oxoprolinase (ATP-hydrolysing) subunit A
MLHRLDLNSDMGERDNPEGLVLDAALMPLITSVNIACGGHAGHEGLMRRTATVARQFGVALGAHPGFPDRATFGRAERHPPADEIRAMVTTQVVACRDVLRTEGFGLRHVKPHGALYNMAAGNEEIAEAIVKAVKGIDSSLLLYALAGSVLALAGQDAGLTVIQEGFADRAYQADGRLAPRSEAGAVIEHQDAVRAQLRRLIEGAVMTVEGTLIPMTIHSLCLHSDTPNALGLARMIREELQQAEIEVRAAGHADH